MINSLLAIVSHSDGNYYFDNFGEALVYALIGFIVVFIGILLVIFVIWLIGFILKKSNNLAFLKNIGKKNKSVGAEITENEATADGDEISDEIKVAVVAAIMAYYDSEKPECEFEVKRIKRI